MHDDRHTGYHANYVPAGPEGVEFLGTTQQVFGFPYNARTETQRAHIVLVTVHVQFFLHPRDVRIRYV